MWWRVGRAVYGEWGGEWGVVKSEWMESGEGSVVESGEGSGWCRTAENGR